MNEEENKVVENNVETNEVVEEKKVEEPVVQEEPKKEELSQEPNNDKKGSKSFTIVLLVIIVLLVAVIVILLMKGNDKNSNNENKENKENTENVENTEIDPIPNPEPGVEEMDINSDFVNSVMNRFNAVAITESELYQSDKYDINNISDNDLIMTSLKSLSGTDYEPTACSNDSKTVTISYLNERLLTRIKGKSIDYQLLNNKKGSIQPNDKVWGADTYEIVDNENISVMNTLCGAEASGDNFESSKLIKAEKTTDYIYLYQKIAFAKFDNFTMSPDDTVSYYLDYARSGNKVETIKDPHYGGDLLNPPLNWDLYNTYKYTFKLIDGEYYFQTLELVK